MTKLSKEQELQIINLYIIDKLSMQKIGKKTGIHWTTINKILIKNNISKRSLSESHYTCKINDNFLNKIDTEEKAYFLGWIYTDGCVTHNTIELTLQEKDKYILEIMKNWIYPENNKKLSYNKPKQIIIKGKVCNRKGQYKLAIWNEKLYKRIKELGIYENKSLTIKLPNFQIIPEHLYHHFLRGVLDGDGWVTIKGKNRNIIGFIGSHDFIIGLVNFLKQKFNISHIYNKSRSDCNNTVSNLLISKTEHIKKIYNYLYEGATIWLERKRDKFNH